MGSITKMLKDISGATEDEKEQKERLELILMLAKSKIQSYKDELNMMFMNPAEVNKIQVPGNRAIRYIEQYHVAVSQSFSQTCGDHMSAAIDAFFSLGEKGGNDKQSIKNGVQALISTALDGFIGSTEVGESEERVYVVIPENNAFVRVDIACWKYHFEQHKIIDQSDTAVAYVLCKSVVNHDDLSIDELIYLASDALSSRYEMEHPTFDKNKIEEEIKKVCDVDQPTPAFTAALANAAKKPVLLQNYGADATAKSAEQKRINKLIYGAEVEDSQLTDTQKSVVVKRYEVGASGGGVNYDNFKDFYAAGGMVDYRWVEKDAENKDVKKWLPYAILGRAIDVNSATKSSPPGIAVVEGYIEELIRVWNKLSNERKTMSH
ncbi:hypothetical protein [Pseudomonas boanensis]|uniref:hypothetical protein n=1 Tax=Metapseudomonas boanensis TaxID=2822138 RepID=UPI0035D5130F